MTSCDKCGHESSGAFCGNCGADLRGSDDATSTAEPEQSREHHEGWQDDATYTGYQSYRSHPSGTPRPYRSAGMSAGAGTGGAAAAPQPQDSSSGRRGNQMLAVLVGVVAITVCALVAYLLMRPGNDGSSTATPSAANNSTVSTSASASSSANTSSSSSQGNQPQQTVTQTATSSQTGGGNNGGGNNGGGNNGGNSANGYTFQQDGDSVTVMNGQQQVGNLQLNGYRSDQGGNQHLNWAQLPGCKAPILVWNAGRSDSSAAFGVDSSGNYQMFESTGSDLAPTGGNGSNGHAYGVYNRNDHIAYADSYSDHGKTEHDFDSCNSDQTTLHFSGVAPS